MSERTRRTVFLVAGAGLVGLYLWGLAGLPAFGHYRGPYGLIINAVVVHERVATNAVTAVVFDYRAFDTLGEEFILFTAAAAVALLLREGRDEHERPGHGAEGAERAPETSEALRVLGVALIGVTVLLGLYIVAHGQLTPGGGFQGGVIVTAGILLVYVAGEFVVVSRIHPVMSMEAADALGAGAFAALGIGSLLAGAAFLHNFLALGSPGSITSAGIIPLANAAVGVEVAGAVLLILSELLEQALIVRGGRRA